MKQSNRIFYKLLMRLGFHLLFWTFVYLFYSYFFGYGSDIEGYGSSFARYLMPITLAITYLLIYHLIPKYLLHKRYWKFGLYTFYTLIVSSYLIYISVFYGLVYLSKSNVTGMPIASKNIVFIMVGVYVVVFLVSAFKLMLLQINSVEQKNALEQKILEAQLKLKEQELKYLKMQIHPHFLFNTLNTMYGFALKKADETPEMILKLSNLLDYLLYQVDKPLVSLKEEINHIEDYISLEKMRFNDTLEVSFSEASCSKTIMVAPMLFLPFVENSFKHGKIIDGKLSIHISFKCESDSVYFHIKNSHSKSSTLEAGIGLDNIKKRLDFLYKGLYNLEITNDKSFFEVTLKLLLSNG